MVPKAESAALTRAEEPASVTEIERLARCPENDGEQAGVARQSPRRPRREGLAVAVDAGRASCPVELIEGDGDYYCSRASSQRRLSRLGAQVSCGDPADVDERVGSSLVHRAVVVGDRGLTPETHSSPYRGSRIEERDDDCRLFGGEHRVQRGQSVDRPADAQVSAGVELALALDDAAGIQSIAGGSGCTGDLISRG